MRRNYLRGLLIVLLPSLMAAGFVAHGFYRESIGDVGFRRGIDLAGGTILVYEVDKERTESKKDADGISKREPLTNEDIRQLAEKLKRRIDPNDLKNVVVRPVGDSRVEIILPFAGSTGGGKEAANAEFVEEVRNLVKQAGVLEFRILANFTDDKDGWEEARRLLDDADPAAKLRLEELAKAGKLPPAPERTFPVKAEGQEEVDVRYEWVELSAEERESLGLSNHYEFTKPSKEKPNPLWSALKRERGKTFPEVYTPTDQERKGFSYLLYSRDYIKTAQANDDKDKKVEYFVLTRVSPRDRMQVTGDIRMKNVTSTQDGKSGNPAVGFGFNSTGAAKFRAMTERNKPTNAMVRNLAIVMDDKVVSAPGLQSVLGDSGQITGNFTNASVNRLVNILRSGNLNADLKPDPVSENTVGATLGESTIRKGLISVAAAFAAVLIFMVFYYKFAGVVACTALFLNLLLTIGFMVAVNAAFTLPGLAGLVLMLGMAVDANVLIYERIREEKERGATLAQAVRLGYDRAFATIIDTHLTSIFTCIVLYTFGNDNLKGFAISLTVGLIISLFTSLYMTRLMFDYWIHKRWMTEYTPHKLFSRPSLNFMKIRNQMFILTGLLTVVGLGIFLARGERVLNVDFTKGTVYGGRLREGEERSLSTRDGKLGLVELLSEQRQKERLKVKDVIWRSESVGTDAAEAGEKITSENIYEIIYDDGERAYVSLANLPEGPTKEAQREDLKARTSHLPDASIEQVFLKEDNFAGNKSRSFTVRTTERESELVQLALDRLLRDDQNQPLLQSSKVVSRKFDGSVLTITLDSETSPGYMKRFLERRLRLAMADRSLFLKANDLEVKGVQSSDLATASREALVERYKTISIDFGNIPEFKPLKDPALKPEERTRLQGLLEKPINEAIETYEKRPIPDRLETFDPALASDTRNKALFAIVASWIAILAFLWFRFGSWTFGLAAVLCLIHDLCFTLGCIAACHFLHDTMFGHLFALQDFKIDLAAVAALLTLVGYSVNDTIVVFDRIREVRGKNPMLTEQMLNDSVNQTLSRTILAAMTVFLVVAVLYFFGGEGVHLFSFVMVVGVLVGTYSSIYIAAPLLLIFGEGHVKNAASHMAVIPENVAPSATTS